jgi:hypothetical protein
MRITEGMAGKCASTALVLLCTAFDRPAAYVLPVAMQGFLGWQVQLEGCG